MEGIDRELAYQLASHGIRTVDDLADQSVDELMVIEGLDAEKAASLIMTARSSWFAEG
jgi:N utilization substance protein A